MALVIGITGGIATGKSTVLRMLGDLGAQTISADDIAHEVMQKGTPAYGEVVEHFGEEILLPDGEIDRRVLGNVVFQDFEARKYLEAVTHPRIIDSIENSIHSFKETPPSSDAVLVVEIPLLVECGLEGIVDEVLLVAAEQETQISRLTSRSSLSSEEALRRIQAQMPLECKIDHADWVIWNDGDLEILDRSVRSVWEEIHLL